MSRARPLPKAPTGITGLDQITHGGLPRGRPTLVCGGAGCGKTLMAMEFLVRGATEYDEPGVYFAFEERPQELSQNVQSLGFDLRALERAKKFHLEYVHIDPADIEETGAFDLQALFIRLGDAIDSINAKRVVLDTIEVLFGGFANHAILRSELDRLFRWLKDRGVTAIITGETGQGTLTRQGLEEYVSDCVIMLDHRVVDQISTRRLRVVKYRGSTHGTNEYPFLIDERGIDVLPVTSLQLNHRASNERISTGIAKLDGMFDGGIYCGSTVLISGAAGTGKTSIASSFIRAAARENERSVYFAFEESPAQIARNMQSIGINLAAIERKGLLRFVASRPALHGLESHLAVIHQQIREFKPRLVIIDPISDLTSIASVREAKTMLTRVIDFLKSQQITAVLTALNASDSSAAASEIGVSSLIDTWILLRNLETDGERTRGLYILKSRGMAHSNQVREFLVTDQGIDLQPVYIGPGGAVTGSARVRQEAHDRAAVIARQQEIERQKRALERRRRELESQISSLQMEIDEAAVETRRMIREAEHKEQQFFKAREAMAQSRHAVSESSSSVNGRIPARRDS